MWCGLRTGGTEQGEPGLLGLHLGAAMESKESVLAVNKDHLDHEADGCQRRPSCFGMQHRGLDGPMTLVAVLAPLHGSPACSAQPGEGTMRSGGHFCA